MRAFPVAAVLFLSVFPGAARAVTVSELPATIQSCILAGSCAVDYSSSYSSERVSAFAVYDASTLARNNYWNDWLIRYDLVPPSGQTGSVQPSAFDGYLWMRVQGMYSAVEAAHPVTLFLDNVTPVPGSLFGQSGDLSLTMTTADLLAGGALRTTGYISDYDDPNFADAGSLSGEIPLLCLAVGCQTSAQLNLVQLSYQSFGSLGIAMTGFDASDSRGLVFSQSSSYLTGDPYADYSATQAFYISAVPEAQASWMFGLGLLVVFSTTRRNRKKHV